MRKLMLVVLVAGSTLLGAAAVPTVRALADTASTTMPTETHRGPLARFLRAQLGRLMTLREELDLTDAQKSQLREIVKSHKSEIVAAIKPVMEKRRALHDAVLGETTDEKAIRSAADDLGKAVGDASVLAAKIKQEAAAVLTPDQRQKLSDFRAQVEKSVDELMQKVGSD